MIKSVLASALLFGGVLVAPSVFAVPADCSAAVEVFSNNDGGLYAPAGATTCGEPNRWPIFPGVIASPQPDVVYKFTADSASATITLDANGGPFAPAALILDSCDMDSANIFGSDGGAAGGAISINANGLTDGHEYFLVVTSTPGSPDDNCGAFSGTITGQLPVALQSFSID